MRVAVNDDRCRGHGMCLTFCPEVFEITDHGYAVANPDEVAGEFEGAVAEAIDNCPERAISEV